MALWGGSVTPRAQGDSLLVAHCLGLSSLTGASVFWNLGRDRHAPWAFTLCSLVRTVARGSCQICFLCTPEGRPSLHWGLPKPYLGQGGGGGSLVPKCEGSMRCEMAPGTVQEVCYWVLQAQLPLWNHTVSQVLEFWAWDWCSSFDNLWIAFGVILPWSSTIASGFCWDGWLIQIFLSNGQLAIPLVFLYFAIWIVWEFPQIMNSTSFFS